MLSGLRALALASCLVFASELRAEESPAVTPADRVVPPPFRNPEGRYLGGHLFPRLGFVPSPFTETRFSLRQGAVAISVPRLPVSQSYAEDVHTLGITETLEIGVELFDRLELFGALGGQVVTGVEVPSILTLGASYAYSFGGGAALRLFTLNLTDTLFSLRAHANHSPGGSYELIRLLDAVRNQDIRPDQLLGGGLGRIVRTTVERTELNAHLVIAQAILRNFGVQAGFGFSRSWLGITAYDRALNRELESTSGDFSPDVSAGIDVNLEPYAAFAFSAEYSLHGQRPEVTNASAPGDLTQVGALGVHWLHARLQVSLCLGRAFGLEPLVRELDATTTQRTGNPGLTYGLLLVHINPPR